MKKSILVLAAVLIGCVSQDFIPADQAVRIPANADKVVAYSAQTPQDLYAAVYKALILDGHRIAAENKDMMTLSTEGKDIGESVTVRLTVVVEKTDAGSRAILRGDWRLGQMGQMWVNSALGVSTNADWMAAAWKADEPRSKRAFSYMTSVAKKVSTDVKYW